MRRDYPDRPVVGVIAMVRRDQRFLLVRRAKPPNQGFWAFPGGVQELGETIIEAALRELAEETALIGSAPEIFATLDVIDRDDQGAVRYHFTLIAVLLHWASGEGVANDESEALGWFGPDHLADLAVLPNVERLMRQALAADRRALS